MTDETVRALADRAQITDTLIRYAEGLDRHDLEAVRSCFAPEVSAEYGGVTIPPGVDALVEHISIVETFVSSMHLVGNVVIDLRGDEAHSSCRCVAYVLRDRQFTGEQQRKGDVRLFMRGLTYEDRWSRRAEGFRIVHRRHVAEWQVELPVEVMTVAHQVFTKSLYSS